MLYFKIKETKWHLKNPKTKNMQGYLITKCIFWAGQGRGGGGATNLPGSAPDPNCSTMQPFALTQVCTFYIFIVFKIYSNLYNVYVTCTHFSIEFTQFNKFNLSNILNFFFRNPDNLYI